MHSDKSRTKNVFNNMFYSLGTQVLNLALNFVSRTVFISVLSVEYLGINSLFLNVITILSFAELGIGNAIIFSMYKPLAYNDMSKLNSLMSFYKKAYRIIGLIVAAVGILIIPFLNIIAKDTPNISENLTLIYLLFLFNTVSSYFLTYKKSIIIADQKNYIVDIYSQIIKTIQVIIQIAILVTTQNYLLFLITEIVSTFIINILLALKANKMYPFLKEKSDSLSRSESKEIFKNIRALFVYKFGSVVLNGTDNILISYMINVSTVGVVSNYLLLITACQSILAKITGAFTASIGNLNAVAEKEKRYSVFEKLFFINYWVFGYVSIALLHLLNDFILVWLGESYILPFEVVVVIVLHFYVFGVHNAASTYRTTLGYFDKGKIAPFLAAVLNIFLSIIMGKWIGLTGIFLATTIARLLTMGIVDPVLIFKNSFFKPVTLYYRQYILYTGILLLQYFLNDIVLSFINVEGWQGIVLQAFIITLVFNLSMFIIFYRNNVFREIINIAKGLFMR